MPYAKPVDRIQIQKHTSNANRRKHNRLIYLCNCGLYFRFLFHFSVLIFDIGFGFTVLDYVCKHSHGFSQGSVRAIASETRRRRNAHNKHKTKRKKKTSKFNKQSKSNKAKAAAEATLQNQMQQQQQQQKLSN